MPPQACFLCNRLGRIDQPVKVKNQLSGGSAKVMLYLPAIQGRFPVGITTFAATVKSPRPIGNVKLRIPRKARQNHPNSALYLEEVAFTAFYPTEAPSKSSKKGADWLLR